MLPEILAGRKISALAITEPGGGSDVANLATTARRDGDHYVVRGEKTVITSGMRADYYTVAVRTGGDGAGGVSLLLIERDTPGFARTPLKKMGWWASDTATLHFDDCRVPAGNLIGPENGGFRLIMKNFNSERLGMAAGCASAARVCVEEAIAYARERRTFGKRLTEHQVIRHKIVDMAQRVAATQAMLEMLIWRLERGDNPVAEVCMCKNQATQDARLLRLRGGAEFSAAPATCAAQGRTHLPRGEVNAIGGGTEEIMKDLASRQMGSDNQARRFRTQGQDMKFTPEHDAIRRTMQQFIKNEINPFVDEWSAPDLSRPRGVQEARRSRLLGLCKPVEYGGAGLDYSYGMVMRRSSAPSRPAASACRSACRPTWRPRRWRGSARIT